MMLAVVETLLLVALRAAGAKAAHLVLTHSLNPSLRSATGHDAKPSPFEALFCFSFAESMILGILVLFQPLFVPSALWFNWHWSLALLTVIIVLVAPFLQCFLAIANSRLSASFSHLKTVAAAAMLYTSGLLVFFYLGNVVAHSLGVSAGSQAIGFYNALLERLCVPGTFVLAGLSGAGAIHTAYDAYEWRKSGKRSIKQGQIDAAENSLSRVRNQISTRESELSDAQESAMNEQENGAFSAIAKYIPGLGGSSRISNLSAEIDGLRTLEAQMVSDVDVLNRRKTDAEQSKTFVGRMWQLFGYAFSLYCAYRIIMSAANLIFGLASSSSSRDDLITAVLSTLASSLNIEIDVATCVKVIGFAFIGGIIVVNLNSVLYYVSRAFRVTSEQASTSFLLLFLTQLVALYMITSLISLPSTHGESKDSGGNREDDGENKSVLQTLPDFAIFSRLFDAVFLLSALIWLALRYVRRQVRLVDEPDVEALLINEEENEMSDEDRSSRNDSDRQQQYRYPYYKNKQVPT